MAQKNETIQALCPKCSCDTVMPLMRIWISMSFSGNRLTMEWPSRGSDNQEHANVACPQCGAVLRIQADGQVIHSGNYLFSGKGINGKKPKRRGFSKV